MLRDSTVVRFHMCVASEFLGVRVCVCVVLCAEVLLCCVLCDPD